MKKYQYILCILLSGILFSCSKIGMEENIMTDEQQSLIGTAVNFNASYAEGFDTKASSYTTNFGGNFNQNDRMRIYRSYYENGTWSTPEAFRTYRYVYKADATTGISLGTDWLPEAGRQGYDDRDGNGTYEYFTQAATDSLIWENGKTVRFRAWSQSNYDNILYGASTTYFYPDFCLADYVNASGPSTSIPLVLKHLGSRIVFNVKQGGNEIDRVELCVGVDADGNTISDAWKDYKYADNSDTSERDDKETSITDEKAQEYCDLVTAVYKQMCMPAGVDLARSALMTVKRASWNNLTSQQVQFLEDQSSDIFIKYGDMTDDDIASTAKRPFFCNIASRTNQVMVTIPYNISSNSETQGKVLTLPACTRFRIYMRDVNNGDGSNTNGYEGAYHILSLSDVVDSKGNHPFENGLKFGAGKSFTFTVGYRYDQLYVVVNESLSWSEQDLGDADATDRTSEITVSSEPYKWWKDAIHDAIPTGTEDYKPVFHISTEAQFLEFINLVNGTATTKTDGLYLLDTGEKDASGNAIKKWSTVNSVYKPNWVEESDMEAEGYIFYDHYYAKNADQAAYSERDYLKGSYSFYDESFRRNFTVELDADLDLKDCSFESVGKLSSTPFMGNFDGNGHTIKNVNMATGYIFGYMNGEGTEHASITNLCIESVHNTCLLDTGINQIYIAGISIKAPSTGNSIARSLSMNTAGSATSYVVGCIHIGDAGGALVGTASDVNMFGCMQAASGISGGALIGTDANSEKVFTPQVSLTKQKAGTGVNTMPSFRNFIANYYDKELSPSATAVGGASDDYSLREYIRGSDTYILRAKNNYLTSKVSMAQLLAQSNYTQYYGLAPWRAMNYCIYWYNEGKGSGHPCTMHFKNNTTGYAHSYPVLVYGDVETKYTSAVLDTWNPVEQTN